MPRAAKKPAAAREGGGAGLTAKEKQGLQPIEAIDAERFEREQARRRKFLEKREAAAKARRKQKLAKQPQFAMYSTGKDEEKKSAAAAPRQPHDPPITFNHLSTKERAPAAPLSFRPREPTQQPTPGPGSYAAPSSFGTAYKGGPRFHRPLREKEIPMFFSATPSPGPTTYSLPSDFSPSKSKGFSIASNLELTKSAPGKDPPGPGSYSLPGTLGKAHGKIQGMNFSLSGRPREKQPSAADSSPGPGAYNPTEPYNVQGPSFTCGRYPPNTANGPGPGTYNVPEMGNTKGTVTIKGRTPLLIPTKGQGPPSTLYNIAPPAKEPPKARAPRRRAPPAITDGSEKRGGAPDAASPPQPSAASPAYTDSSPPPPGVSPGDKPSTSPPAASPGDKPSTSPPAAPATPPSAKPEEKA
eukprot:TRINITY_DN1316_c0_g1_i1.p1 TRINITY_DN1316_c0_g1~~TRINITY_DN1316_c0_g1_i1.p1  ORF type:complete len:434 (+),score=151.25 TRINITY_DN1316_c0_g1_i1:68-1303(+)